MRKQIKMGSGAVVGLAALALGGSAIAGASSSAPHVKTASLVSTVTEPKATEPDIGNVQSGDQTTPDTSQASKTSEPKAPGPDTDNIQSGDQTTPDAGQAGQASTESSSPESSTTENSAPSDGPGGHADPAGNVNNQQPGQN